MKKFNFNVFEKNVFDISKLTKVPTKGKSRIYRSHLEGMQNGNHETVDAINEFVDNSIDAKAKTIKIYINEKNNDVIIIDDGEGMGGDELESATEFGSNQEMVRQKDKLGFYGVGSGNATLSLSRKREIYTKKVGTSVVNYESFDLDSIPKGDVWCPTVYLGNDTHEKIFSGCGLNGQGTIIRLHDCNRISYNSFKLFIEDIRVMIGEIYRVFINNGIKIYVNDIQVDAIDPLFWNHKSVERLKEGDVLHTDKKGVEHKLHIKIVALPRGQGKRKDGGFNMTNDKRGVYILRDGRQIKEAVHKLGRYRLMQSHTLMNSFRVELSFNNESDDILGVNNTKNQFTNPNAEVCSKIYEYILPEYSKLRRKIMAENAKKEAEKGASEFTETEDMLNLNSEKFNDIKNDDDGIIPPKPEKPKDNKPKPEKPKPEKPKDKKKKKAFEIRTEPHSPYDPIFRYEYGNNSKKIIIIWNTGHAFYAKYIAKCTPSVRDSSTVLAAALLRTLASFESRQEVKADIIEEMNIQLGTNARFFID